MLSRMQRTFLKQDTFADRSKPYWAVRGDWPAFRVDPRARPIARPSVALFRLEFPAERSGARRLRVSADNRHRLYHDGPCLGSRS